MRWLRSEGRDLNPCQLELQEDIEDYKDAKKILAQNNPSYSLEEVMEEFGLPVA